MTKPKATKIKEEEKKPTIEAKFAVGEEFVHIYKADGMPYKAKVLAVNANNAHPHYDIHYVGWSASFDSKVHFTEQDTVMFKGSVEQYKAEHPVKPKPIQREVGGEEPSKKKSAKRAAPSTSSAPIPSKKAAKSSKSEDSTSVAPGKKKPSKSPATTEFSGAAETKKAAKPAWEVETPAAPPMKKKKTSKK